MAPILAELRGSVWTSNWGRAHIRVWARPNIFQRAATRKLSNDDDAYPSLLCASNVASWDSAVCRR